MLSVIQCNKRAHSNECLNKIHFVLYGIRSEKRSMAIGDKSSSVRNWIDRFVSSVIIKAHGAVTELVIYSSWVPEIVSSAVRFSVHRHLSTST